MVFGDVAPEGGYHEGLLHLVTAEKVDEFLKGEEMDGDFLGFIEVLGVHFLHSLGDEGVVEVVHGGGIG